MNRRFGLARWGGRLLLLLGCAWVIAGCQALGPTPAPTPTPIWLAASGRAPATATPVPRAAATLTALPPTSTATTTAVAAAEPTAATPTVAALMALGSRPTFVVRSLPQADAPIMASLPGSQVVWVEGRSADGRWLYVAYGEAGDRGWALQSDLTVLGEMAGLPRLSPPAAAAPTARPGAASADRPAAARPPAPAAAAGFGGKVVFQAASGGDIYLVNADGSGLRRLTDGLDPALSPDGNRVAFARWGSPHGIYVLDLRTGQEQRVASANRPRGPTWSPDGQRLAFTHVARTRTCIDLGFACLDIEEVRRLFGGQDCIITPQGRRCIGDYPVVTVDDNGLVVFDAQTGARRDLLSEGTIQSVQWRPGQNELLFRGRTGLQTLQPDSRPVPLADDPNLGSPAWSPDGQRIVAQLRIHNRTEIVLLDANGAVAAYLTQPPPTYERPGQPPPHNVAPAWSPDGRAIIFLSDRSGAWRLYVMNADGSGQRPFLPDVLADISIRYDFAAERVANWGR